MSDPRLTWAEAVRAARYDYTVLPHRHIDALIAAGEALVRSELMHIRAEIQADASGIYGEPSGLQALRIIDIRLRRYATEEQL